MTERYDLIALGGGSGGLSVAQRATEYGARCVVVESGPLGGTCVNSGCVPKKVMWHAAEMRRVFDDAPGYGLQLGQLGFDWAALKRARDAYVQRLNGWYERYLLDSGVELARGEACFVAPNQVQVGDRLLQAEHVVIASGSQPEQPQLPGAQLGLSSDGFFRLEALPARVAVVGAGYIAVELAGILHSLGAKVSMILRRSQFLRGFDAMIRAALMEHMAADGIALLTETLVQKVEQRDHGRLLLTCAGAVQELEVDSLIWAIGRRPRIEALALEAAGIRPRADGSIPTDEWQSTEQPGHYAIGDVTGRWPLTPVAIAAGRRLADRLFGGQPERRLDYELIPTVIFSHPPVGTVGLSEEEAQARYGERVKVYTNQFIPLYYGPLEHKRRSSMKLVCVGTEERMVGLHVVGADADELLQGFAVALRMGARKRDLDDTVAIHPTSAEELVTMR